MNNRRAARKETPRQPQEAILSPELNTTPQAADEYEPFSS